MNTLPRTLLRLCMVACLATASAPLIAAEADISDEGANVESKVPGVEGGAGDLLVAPTRVVLEGRTRSSQIILSNTGSKEATYRISLTQLRMDDNGKYHEISENNPNEKNADHLLRFSPHQVTLKPGESQAVKVTVRKTEGITDGEYLSHMIFRAIPDVQTGEDVEAQNISSGISIRLIPVHGVSIPIIVRQGNLNAKANITDLKLAGNALSFTLTRNGTKSTYGDIIATYTPGSGGKKVVGEMRGVAVFATNQTRHVILPLNENATLGGGSLTVEYLAREEQEGQTLAKTSLKL